MPRVFITGLGFVTSIGNDASTIASNLRELRHGFELYPPFQKPEAPCKVVGTIKEFTTDSVDPEDWTWPKRYTIKRETLRSMAPHGLFAHCAFLQAIEDARLEEADISNPSTGMNAASGGSPFLTNYNHARLKKMGVMRCSPMAIVSSIVGTLNFNLVAAFKILGSSCGFSSACASSAHAMGFAFDEIATGRQQRMFVVGGEDGNEDAILPFAGMRTLSLQTDPDLASRPFDAARDGFVGTGGATVMVLESEDEVARRGARPYAQVLGWGQASDGYNIAISHPDGAGLRLAMANALRQSGVEPEEVDYVNAHATSTVIGDIAEARAIRAVFPDAAKRPAVSSTKALTGHGLCLSGVMESGFCALAMREGFTPGAAHISKIDPACEGLNLPRATLPTAPSLVMKNSSGFGGANAVLLSGRSRLMGRRVSELHRTAWVTGAGSGLGRAFSEMLLSEGVRVWGTSRDPARLAGAGCVPVALDLADPAGAIAAYERSAAEAGGAFDLVVNNAGYGAFGAFDATERTVWEEQLRSMLVTTVSLTHRAFSAMLSRNRGTLVNVSSLAAEFPLPFMSGYNVAKAGLSALSESLIFESRGSAVSVIDFRPGDYRTAFNQAMQTASPDLSPRPAAGPPSSGGLFQEGRERRLARAWRVLDANLSASPPPSRAAADLRRALLRPRSGVVRSGSFFQARLAPVLARLAPASLLGPHPPATSAAEAQFPLFLRVSKIRILVLTSSTGGGHDARAAAFAEWCFQLYRHDVDVRIEQMLEKSSVINRAGVNLYNRIQRSAPWVHKLFYGVVELLSVLNRRTVTFGRSYFVQVVKEYKPHLIFSVHDCLNRGYFQLARRVIGENRVRCATYCGEFSGGWGYSRNWIEPTVDLYISRTPTASDFAVKRGIPRERSLVRGYLTLPRAHMEIIPQKERGGYREKRLGLRPDLFTVFLATGGNGANNHFELLPELLRHADKCQAIVICGRNKETYNELVHWRANHPEFNCYIEGFSDIVHLLMQVSEVIVTRGGTTTCANALHFKCPIIFNAFGGIMPQEQLTWKFFRNGASSVKIERADDFAAIIDEWMRNPSAYARVRDDLLKLRDEEDPTILIDELVGLANGIARAKLRRRPFPPSNGNGNGNGVKAPPSPALRSVPANPDADPPVAARFGHEN